MERHLLREIKFKNGELYISKDGRRHKLSDCEPLVRVYDCRTQVPILNRGMTVKHKELRIVLREDNEPTTTISEDTFKGVTCYDLSMEYWRPDCTYETITLNNILPTVIDLDAEWEFEVPDRETVKKLSAY